MCRFRAWSVVLLAGCVEQMETAPPDASAPVDELAYLKKPVPVLSFTIGGKPIVREPATPGVLKVVEQEGQPPTLETKVTMALRGQSSSNYYAQKPYSIELVDDMGLDKAAPLLDMPKESDWVLSSCYSDKTCLRNALTYAIGREAGAAAGRWAPRTRWAEVNVDGQYQGLYLVVEKPKADKGRVNIKPAALNANLGDVTGGHMWSADGDMGTFSYNKLVEQREWFDMRINRRWKHRTPSWHLVSPEQKAYISTAFTALQDTLVARGDWRSKIDAQSWFDYFLLSEFSNNVDTFFRSWFFYKTPEGAGGKFFMGPIWDYDLAYGNANYGKKYCATNTVLTPPSTFNVALVDPQFQNDMRCRWHDLRKDGGPLDLQRIEAKIDAFAAHIKAAKTRDMARWKNVGLYVWPNNYIGATWENEIAYLKYWLHLRLPWVDKNLKGVCPSIPAPPVVPRLPQPPNAPDDGKRVDQAMAKPSQINLASTPNAFVPIEGTTDPKWACPAP